MTKQVTRVDITELDDESMARLNSRLTFEPRSVAVLAEFSEGDAVDVPGTDDVGVVVSVMTESFRFPAGGDADDPEYEEIEASGDNPVYVVATVDGPIAVSEDEVSSASFDVDIDEPEEDLEDLEDEVEENGVYDRMDDPNGSIEELRAVKREYVVDQLDYTPEGKEYEELVNIKGVEDPHIGFKDWPPSWKKSERPARVIAMYTWARLGGKWRTCVAEMTGNIRNPQRFCAAFKDEILQTTRWRNRF